MEIEMKYKELMESLLGEGDGTADLEFVFDSMTKNSKYKKVFVDVDKFDSLWKKDKDFYIGKNGVGGIKGRYERFQDFIKNHNKIEMSDVSITKDGAVSFRNGRHRFAVLRDMGMKEIPVAMHKDYIKYASQYGVLVN
jgi:hypothetical protein